jgi:hypothetical protein
MLQLRSFAVFSLLLYIYRLPCCVAQAADPLHERVLLEGPEPQPIFLDSRNNRRDSGPMNDKKPVTSAPFPKDAKGGRKLNTRQTSNSQATSPNPDTLVQSDHRVRSRSGASPTHVSRSMQDGECRITNTIFGFNFDDILVLTGNALSPPNPHGAVGASRLVSVADSIVEVREKDGTLKFSTGWQTFFSAVPAASDSVNFFQPKVIYDEHEGRFLLVALQQFNLLQISRIWVAVSKDETPESLTDWRQTFIDSTSFVGDSYAFDPGLEVDEEAVYITVNTF